MKKRMILMLLLVSIFGVSSFFTGCKKKDSTTSSASVDTETASDDAVADNTFTDVDNIGTEAVINSGAGKTGGVYFYINTQCATITVDSPVAGTWKVTIDFGTTGCICKDGKTRSGQIIINWTGGRFMDKGTVINYTLNNYQVKELNGITYKVAGSKTVTNLGPNSSGQPQWHIVVTGGQITRLSDGAVATYSSDRIRTWSAGYNTIDISDDEYLISNGDNTVTDQGTSFKGVAYTITITKPLHIVIACTWKIESGTLALTAGTNNATVDYGNDTCNDTLTATINGKSYTIVRP